MEGVLENEDYLKVLQERFGVGVKLVGAQLLEVPLSVQGCYVLNLQYDLQGSEGSHRFLVKTNQKPSGEVFRYYCLIKRTKNLGCFTGFAPEVFYCKDLKTFVLEDLIYQGYKVIPPGKPFDIDHCKLALKSLAHLHANSIIFEEKRSKDLERSYRITEECSGILQEEILILPDNILESCKNIWISICNRLVVPREWKLEFYQRIIASNWKKIDMEELQMRKTMLQGNVLRTNILFRYENDSPVNCTFLEVESLTYFHSSFDVLLLIHQNTGRSFRRKNLKQLLRYYYDCFEEVLEEQGASSRESLPWEDFWMSGRILERFIVVQAAIKRTVPWFERVEDGLEKEEELEMAMKDLIFDLYDYFK